MEKMSGGGRRVSRTLLASGNVGAHLCAHTFFARLSSFEHLAKKKILDEKITKKFIYIHIYHIYPYINIFMVIAGRGGGDSFATSWTSNVVVLRRKRY